MSYRNVTRYLLILCTIWLEGFSQINFTKKIIANNFILAKKFVVADINRDGYLDIAGAANDTSSTSPVMVAWFENDGNQVFTQYNLDTNFPTARSVYAGDFDPSSPYLQIAAGNTNGDLVRFYEYNGSSWTSSVIGTTTPNNNYHLTGADINGDGNLDLLGTASNFIGWYQNDGSANFIERIIGSGYTNAIGAEAGYINTDNYIDVVGIAFSIAINNVRWYANDGSPEDGGWTLSGIASNRYLPNGQDLTDLDGDGDLDVVVAEYGTPASSYSDGRISWWSNNGSGTFTFQENITTNLTESRCVKGADMDGDGDMDLVSAASLGNPGTGGDVSWYENNGSQSFTKRTITTTFDYAYWTEPVDLEGDGDMDIVASAQDVNQIAWWKNDLDDDQLIAGAGSGTFWNGNVVIDFNSSSGGEDSVTVFYNAGKTPNRNALGTGIDHIAERGYYTITTKKSSYDAGIDFHYGNGYVPEWSAITPGSESDLVICIWDDTNSEWVIAGTSQTVDAVNDSVAVNGISSEMKPFSKWTIGSRTSDNPLPVELFAFTSEILSDGVKLNWSTASEINNVGFEIWRSDKNDSNYVLLSDFRSNENLVGAGNSTQLRNYSYTDKNVRDNFTYRYKIVDVDVNNQKTVHGPLEVTFIQISIATSYQLGQNYPNPFNGYTKIPIYLKSQNLSGTANGTLQIFNLLGKQVKKFNLNLVSSGKNEIRWDGKDNLGNSVASGQYFYQVELNGEIQSRKLILIR